MNFSDLIRNHSCCMCHVNNAQGEYVDVAPIGDRLVIFPSEFLRHEVMPSYHDRFAVVVWFKANEC
jgi:predicted 2-oxoglutarate/Fe(II)-dependent dioxygenase YbiX